jgi:hypothetical protein
MVDNAASAWNACNSMKRLGVSWHLAMALGIGCAEPYESLPSDAIVKRVDAGGLLDGGFTVNESGSGPDAGTSADSGPDAGGGDSGVVAVAPDAGTSADSGGNEFNDAIYCKDWTYCDTFEGSGNIPWQSNSSGPSAKTEISASHAKSGTYSLRGYRTQTTTDWAELLFNSAAIQQCEYDVLVPNTPGTSAAFVEVAYFSLNGALPDNYLPNPVQIFFTSTGIRLSEYHYGQFNNAVRFLRQPVRDAWHHMGVELTRSNTGATGSKASLAAGVQGPESRVLSFSEIAYTNVNFAIGLTYDDTATANIEVYIDNVRCK